MMMDGIRALIAAHWDLDFNQFCELVGLPRADRYERERAIWQWDRFQKLVTLLKEIDDPTLTKLTAYRRRPAAVAG